MTTAAALLSLTAAMTPLAIMACYAIDRHIRRKGQLAYLRGPLRDQVMYMMNSPALAHAPALAHTMHSNQPRLAEVESSSQAIPAGLLTHKQLSA